MPSGAVPDRADAIEIDGVPEAGQEVDSRRDVEKGLGPAAAVPDAPVLEIPGGKAVLGQVLAEARHQRSVVARSPVAAVDDDDDRIRTVAVGDEQLTVLARIVSVAVQRALDPPSLAGELPTPYPF
jgi:hypothetical protein